MTTSADHLPAAPAVAADEPSLLIDGRWVRSSDGGLRECLDPADGSVIATVDEATPADATRAVAAARRAFDSGPWPTTPVGERVALLHRIADLLTRDREPLARIETADTGKTLAESQIDIDDVIAVFRYYAGLAGSAADRLVDVGDPQVISRVTREPIGVCVLIAPWNYPLLQMSWKVAPALAAGCTMIMKPSEVTPLSTIAFARLITEAGVPPGVVNLVQGSGAVLGEALTDTDEVDFISFTGGLATGNTISRIAADARHQGRGRARWQEPARRLRRRRLGELGRPGADRGVPALRPGLLGRYPADRARLDRRRLRRGAGRSALGRSGSGRARIRPPRPVRSSRRPSATRSRPSWPSGLSEGATLVTGGTRPTDPALADGYFFLPTIFDHCDRSMRIVQEETFGPILTVERFHTVDEAITLGNDTAYGLAAGIRTADLDLAERVARSLRHGTVWINDFGYYTAAAEWGGFKKSGNGRELGPTGLAEYQETKHIWLHTAPAPKGWFTGQG